MCKYYLKIGERVFDKNHDSAKNLFDTKITTAPQHLTSCQSFGQLSVQIYAMYKLKKSNFFL
jgi:hypothetical protein